MSWLAPPEWAGRPMSLLDDLALFCGGSGDSFTGDLLRLMMKSDPVNRARLAAAYPREDAALRAWYTECDRQNRPVTFGELAQLLGGPSITCPRCGLTSHNPNDAREGYCGACHDWTGKPVTARVRQDIPADQLKALAAILDAQSVPTETSGLAENAVRNLAKYAPAGRRVTLSIEWETPREPTSHD